MIDPVAQRDLDGSLEPGETLVWTGVPKRGLVLRPNDAFLVPVSLLWAAVVAWMVRGSFRFDGSLFGRIVLGSLVIAGIHFVVGRFFADARLRANTVYGLTDRRAIIVGGLFSRKTVSLPLATLSEITLTERADGSGTISLGKRVAFDWEDAAWPLSGRERTPRFDLIADVRSVHDRIQELRRRAG